jgi:hypothetical protein
MLYDIKDFSLVQWKIPNLAVFLPPDEMMEFYLPYVCMYV